mmetsp:Transcript_99644/g.149215  ORF Transcript_99644/g.149215 Transcript_99644/m.149215 type:complete len:90 (-) Transcript_99644:653-922(-)
MMYVQKYKNFLVKLVAVVEEEYRLQFLQETKQEREGEKNQFVVVRAVVEEEFHLQLQHEEIQCHLQKENYVFVEVDEVGEVEVVEVVEV